MRGAILNEVVRVGLFEEVTFEQSPKWQAGENEVGNLRDVYTRQGKRQCKGPRVGKSLMLPGNRDAIEAKAKGAP